MVEQPESVRVFSLRQVLELGVAAGLTKPGSPDSLNPTDKGSMVIAQPVPADAAIYRSNVTATRDLTKDHEEPGSSNSTMAVQDTVPGWAAAASLLCAIIAAVKLRPTATPPI